MLIAHASSTCDVCLESYTENCSYHSIPCGHVFCLPCLVSTSPARCPLCRHEFSHYSMRKLHLTLPTQRDVVARNLEMKLVQSSPDMTLAEGLGLFQEVQDWLEGEAQDEFLVLRAFAAVLCGFHELKDKLNQNQARAEHNETELKRLLEEARTAKVSKVDGGDYKNKYKAAKTELAVLRAECADIRAEAERQQRNYQAHYAQIQAQAQLQVQAQTEAQTASRRISNPLPTPPRPVEIPFLKYIESHPSSRLRSGNKGKGREPPIQATTTADPMSSAFVPTLSSLITSRHHDTKDGRQEVTTLVFKPPKRLPVWDSPAISYVSTEEQARTLPDESRYPDSPQAVSSVGASVGVETAPDPTTAIGAPAPEVGYSEIHGLSDRYPAAQPPSRVSAADKGESSHTDPSSKRTPSPSKPVNVSWHDTLRYSQEGQPMVDAGAGASHPPIVFNTPPPPGFEKASRRPGWQGGAGTTPRRASTPIVTANSLPPSYSLPVVSTHSRQSEDAGERNTFTVYIRPYTSHDQHQQDIHRSRSYRRPSTPFQGIRGSESHSDPEPQVSGRSAHPSSSSIKIIKEATRYTRHNSHETGHSHSHSLTANTASYPSKFPSSIQSRSHDDLPSSHSARQLSSDSRMPPSRRLTPGELSTSIRFLTSTARRVVPASDL